MSARQRQEAEALRAKYARVYDVPIDDVSIVYLEDEDAMVGVRGLPTWTLGRIVAPPTWATNHRVKTFG